MTSKPKILVKFGGAAMEDTATKDTVCTEIAELTNAGTAIVVVHGGGKEISRWIERFGGIPRFVNGLRVTDADTMKITEMVLSGTLNPDLVSRLSRSGSRCIGISGRTNRTLVGSRIAVSGETDLGYAGEVDSVDASLLKLLLSNTVTPVISPVAESVAGEALNVNADYAAAAIAGALECEICIFLTDVDGVRQNGSVVARATLEELTSLIEDGTITGGMIPKVECAARAIRAGCHRAVIANASTERIIAKILSGENCGTSVTLN